MTRTTFRFDAVRNAALLGVAGIGAAAAIALGPATAANAAHPGRVNPAAPAAAAPAPVALPSQGRVAGYDGALQPNGYYCGPAATRIALSARGLLPTFDALATDLGTTRAGTNSIHDITRVLNAHRGGERYVSVEIPGRKASPEQAERLRTDVMAAINEGDPVVANIVGQVRDNAGEAHRYAGGHYVTITGYADDGRTVTVTDPADRTGANEYDLPIERMANWIAARGYTS